MHNVNSMIDTNLFRVTKDYEYYNKGQFNDNKMAYGGFFSISLLVYQK